MPISAIGPTLSDKEPMSNLEDEPRHLGARPDGHPLRARRLPARARRRADGREGRRAVDGPRRPDRRLRVPLPAASSTTTTSTRSARRSTATTSTRSRAACTSTRASARAGCRRPTTRSAREALRHHARGAPTSPARSARTSSSGRGSRATTTPSRPPYARGVGAAHRRHRPGRRALRRATASSSSSSTRTPSPR